MGHIDFWYSIGSTYTYLTLPRIEAAAQQAGVGVRWRPFNVRTVMVEQNNIPFMNKPVKSAYMWRDIGRRAARYGLTPRLPAPYPLAGLELANRVAVLAEEEGWVAEYTRATYRRWFEEGLPAGEEPNLSASIAETGLDPARVIAQAQGEATGTVLEAVTEEAVALGVFGSPSFVTGGEVFWGDDRLEDALGWARDGGAG
ncbi:MAG: 2-hydroxychromene-2-carboxylate isomerase [Roseovarius sp.]|uniref:2-hydroxychromene-2-carboxylate isomerase n=1 Tax=Roseovarius sp. TaxID=1486281 RepID=UPI0032EB3D10